MKKLKVALCILALTLVGATLFAAGASETTTRVSDNLNAEGLPILKEKETFTIAVQQTSALKSAKDRLCVQIAEEETNIHIEWMEIPSSAWEERINIMASTGTLPDAIIGEAYLDRNYELYAELDDLIDEYAPHVKARLEAREDYQRALKMPDGKIHALPNGDESTQIRIPTHTWINQAWLDKLGLDMPTNTDELREVLMAFKTQDPNGNGIADEIPFAFETGWNWSTSIKNFMGAFGVVENSDHVFMRGNTVVMSALQPEYYEMLKYMADLYANGLINDDVFTISSDQFSALSGGQPIIGMFVGYRNTNALGQPNAAEFVSMPVISSPVSEGVVGAVMPTRVGGFVINAECENPAALVRWYDYLNSTLENALLWGRGEEGFYWDIVEDEEGQHPVFHYRTTDEYKAKGYVSTAEYRSAESFAGNTPAVWWQDYDTDIIYEGDWPFDTKLAAVLRDLPYAVYGLPVGTATEENANRRAILLVDIENYLSRFIADSIINGIDDAKWNSHLNTMKQLRADEYVRLCQEFVDNLDR